MPLPLIAAGAVALIVRQAVMAVVTGAVVTGGQELLDGTARRLVEEIKDKEGVTEQTAKDVVGEIFTDLAVNSTAIMVTLKTGLGVKAAQYLGLTSKGFIKKPLTGSAAALATKLSGEGGKKIAAGMLPKLLGLFKNPSTYFWMYLGFTQAIEPGIYQPKQANDVYQKFTGLRPFPEKEISLQPGPFDAMQFNEYAKAIEAAGVAGLENPVTIQTQLYTRERLAEIINYVYGQEVTKGNKPAAKALIPLLAKYLINPEKPQTTTTTSKPVTTQTTTTPTIKVFTGVVSQGKVGGDLVFTPRPDDLIESVDELKQAAANNLAPYLVALPSRIVYEVKIVSTVTTKSGFTQRGTAQRIQTGTYQNGTPKYKTVVNKFAILNVYAVTDKGSRAKLTTIVLGPTDAAKLTIGQNDLIGLESALSSLVTTSNPNDVENITTPTNDTSNEPKEVTFTRAKTVLDYGYVLRHDTKFPEGYNWISIPGDPTAGITGGFQDVELNLFNKLKAAGVPVINGQGMTIEELGALNFNASTSRYGVLTEKEFMEQLRNRDISQGAGIVVNVPVAEIKAEKSGSKATTLYEWYTMQGKTLPSVEERSKEYARLGLGQELYYTGTAEQNAKLLAALKG